MKYSYYCVSCGYKTTNVNALVRGRGCSSCGKPGHKCPNCGMIVKQKREPEARVPGTVQAGSKFGISERPIKISR